MDAQPFKTDTGSNNIHYSIDGSHFVKMDSVQRCPMHPGFSLCQAVKNPGSPLPNTRTDLALINYFFNSRKVAVDKLMPSFDLEFSGGNIDPMNPLGRELEVLNTQIG